MTEISKNTTLASVTYTVQGKDTTITGHPAYLYGQLDVLIEVCPGLKIKEIRALN